MDPVAAPSCLPSEPRLSSARTDRDMTKRDERDGAPRDPSGDDPLRPDAEPELSAWMRGAQSGDADAYQRLLTTIQPRIRAMARARIVDAAAAEDVVQNALLSIHRGRATYRPERAFLPWMRAIVRNSIIDYFRERKRRSERETSAPVEEWPDEKADQRPQDAVLAPELQDALAALPAKQREAVTLIQIEGLSVAEAALRAGISPGALKVRAHRGYRAMRDALVNARKDGVWRSASPPRVRTDAKDGGNA
jgi:RNA polymerase sigma-70 factor (ECF subfamily)